jgi:8-oxo-dGTP pyrophosphatase MutT (NUDIX family)
MKATFTEITYFHGSPIIHGKKKVKLPFERVTARALIIRRRDGAIFGARHHPGAMFALPGGGLKNRETPPEALLRELEEEDIRLVGADEGWRERFAVDYYAGYRELALWYLITVDEVALYPNPEIIETRWLAQTDAGWWPYMQEHFVLLINRMLPELAKAKIEVIGN